MWRAAATHDEMHKPSRGADTESPLRSKTRTTGVRPAGVVPLRAAKTDATRAPPPVGPRLVPTPVRQQK